MQKCVNLEKVLEMQIVNNVETEVERQATDAEIQSGLRSVLSELNWGVVICIGQDGEKAFKWACANAKPSYMSMTSIFVAKSGPIEKIIEGLSGGDEVTWGEFGHPVIAIDPNDTVSLALSRSEASKPIDVLYACLLASGGG